MSETPTTREAILAALQGLLASEDAEGFFPPAPIDEPELSNWVDLPAAEGDLVVLSHAAAVQDGPPPEVMAVISGPAGEKLWELELEAAIAYVVAGRNLPNGTTDDVRDARRARRDRAPRLIAQLVAADPTLGLGNEVYAEVQPPARDDEVAFRDAAPAATALTPIRILYTAASAAG